MRRRLVIERPVRREEASSRRKAKESPEQSLKQKAQELVDSGMPYQMAMAVVHGKMDLNEALERLARRDRVNQLMERHDLSRALATQIAIGHANLDRVLRRRRLQEHRDDNRDRTCLQEGATLTIGLLGQSHQKVEVVTAESYRVECKLEDGQVEVFHKLALKFAYASEDWRSVRKSVKVDKDVAGQGREPAKRPQDRYTCSDRRLFGYVDNEREASLTFLDGDTLKGQVLWFSRYELGIRVKGDAEVTVFRHALHDLRTA